MKSDPLPASAYLGHMREFIGEIGEFLHGRSYQDFASDRMLQLAVVKSIENIGEAARRLTRDHPEIAARYPNIPWSELIATRNRLTHVYDNINLPFVWEIVESELPILLAALPKY